MKKLLIFAVCIWDILHVSAQDHPQEADSISQEGLKMIVNNQFRNLLAGKTMNSVGSYASADIENKRVTFAPSFALNNGHILSFKANAGVSDGFAQIVHNSKLNTNLSLDAEYHFMRLKKSKHLKDVVIILDASEINDFHRRKRRIEPRHSIETFKISSGQELIALETKKSTLNQKKARLDKLLQDGYLTGAQKDSLQLIILEINLVDIEINEKSDSDWEYEKLLELGNKRADSLKAVAPENLTVYGFRFGWFSLGYQIKHDVFKSFDPTLSFSDQISNKQFTSHQFRIQYSHYRWMMYNDSTCPWFFSGGITFNYKSNFEDLTPVEITEVTHHGTTGTENRKSTEKYAAYTGTYKKGIFGALVNADIYSFCLFKKTTAIHFYPSVRFSEGIQPICNAGIGLLFPFKDKKDNKVIVNAEIYYTLTDIFKSTESDLSLFAQNNMGLRFTFPFNFHPNQKNNKL